MLKPVLITGTSTGIGRDITLDLCKKGFHVFAGVRKMEDADGLVSSGKGKITPLLLDVTDEQSIQAAIDLVANATDGKLYCLINNAGIAPPGPLELLPLDDIKNAINVNLVGPFAMTKAVIPMLRKNNGARIINISSISGLIALPGLSCYAATKHGLEAFNDSLRVELSQFDIFVSAIEPGNILTPIWDKAGSAVTRLMDLNDTQIIDLYTPIINYFEKAAQTPTGSPVEAVTKVATHAVTADKPKKRYLVGTDAKVLKLIGRLPDKVRDKLILKMFS